MSARMGLRDFTLWVNQTLERKSFAPGPEQTEGKSFPPQVIILPLSQLLGRAMSAVVLPGCDEVHLPSAPEPSGLWTQAQRAVLGLPCREQETQALLQSWLYAMRFSRVDVFWRLSEAGEPLQPSGLVQRLLLANSTTPNQIFPVSTPEPMHARDLVTKPGDMPAPTGAALALTRISSSAFEDLRRCPYRFFALRMLKLRKEDELTVELDKRDFGNWLHRVLKVFHETMKARPDIASTEWLLHLNRSAEQATEDLGLSETEFLPFAATWPRVRAGYLSWLALHLQSGAQFEEAETWKETRLGELLLVGQLDRLDRLTDGSVLVIDYKTESRSVTSDRIKAGNEDTQLAFYAALLPDDTLSAAYLSVTEDRSLKDATKLYTQPNITQLRDDLLEGLQADMNRIAAGAPMPAIGEGKACEHCDARGLCRKDFWTLR